MLKKVLFLLLLIANQSFAQENKLKHFFSNSDTLHKGRLRAVSIAQGGIWVSSLIGLNQAWYANYPRSSFHLFDDAGEWQQIDKIGHAFSANWGANLSAGMFRWSGLNRKKAALLGAGMGIGYVSVIEILDGYSAGWGFSLADMAANLSGSLLFLSQELAWQEQRIQFKFSSHLVDYRTPELIRKADDLYGRSTAERILKDYNGQTYWLSLNIWSFAKDRFRPKWLNIALGYGGSGMLGGYTNDWTDKYGVYHDRRDIPRVTQFYLAPDIDLSKIEFRGRKLKLLKMLNGLRLKFPLPALEWNTYGDVKFHPLFF